MTNCNISNEVKTFDSSKRVDSIKTPRKKDTLLRVDEKNDILERASQITSTESTNEPQNIRQDNGPSPTRYIEFPNDAHFNGSPMTQQEEMPKEILENHPDTLRKLAIARYKAYDQYYPKSIADNFEEGISTEHIHYPKKLIFRFELFDNESSWTPYIVKEVMVIRNPNGELFIE